MRSSLLISHRLFVAALDQPSRSSERIRRLPEEQGEPGVRSISVDWEVVDQAESRPAGPVRALRGPFGPDGR
jgi:hypothetical protein